MGLNASKSNIVQRNGLTFEKSKSTGGYVSKLNK